MLRLKSEKDFPTYLWIRGSIWRIEFSNEIIYQGQDCLGICFLNKRLIKIKRGQTPKGTLSTLIHEVLHALVGPKLYLKTPHWIIYHLEKTITNFLEENNFTPKISLSKRKLPKK